MPQCQIGIDSIFVIIKEFAVSDHNNKPELNLDELLDDTNTKPNYGDLDLDTLELDTLETAQNTDAPPSATASDDPFSAPAPKKKGIFGFTTKPKPKTPTPPKTPKPKASPSTGKKPLDPKLIRLLALLAVIAVLAVVALWFMNNQAPAPAPVTPPAPVAPAPVAPPEPAPPIEPAPETVPTHSK